MSDNPCNRLLQKSLSILQCNIATYYSWLHPQCIQDDMYTQSSHQRWNSQHWCHSCAVDRSHCIHWYLHSRIHLPSIQCYSYSHSFQCCRCRYCSGDTDVLPVYTRQYLHVKIISSGYKLTMNSQSSNVSGVHSQEFIGISYLCRWLRLLESQHHKYTQSYQRRYCR